MTRLLAHSDLKNNYKRHEVNFGHTQFHDREDVRDQEGVRPVVHLRERMESAAAYLRVAHIYMLISMPTDTSTIFGAFQAIWLSLDTGRIPSLEVKVSRIKKFAQLNLLPGTRFCLCCAAKGFHGVVLTGRSKQRGIKYFEVVRIPTNVNSA
jgi:hypothetical protein